MNDELNLIVRVMPSGDELDVQIPRFSTGKEIIEELLRAEVAPSSDGEGNPFVYELVSKKNQVRVDDNKTLHDLQINDGDTLLFIPNLVAG